MKDVKSTMNTRHANLQLRVSVGLSVFLILGYIILFCSHHDDSPIGGPPIIVIHPIYSYIFWLVLALAIVGFAFSIWTIVCRQRAGILLLLVTLGALPVTVFEVFMSVFEYDDCAMVRDKDGSEYHLLTYGSIRGSLVEIAKLSRRGLFREEFVVLANAGWDDSSSFLWLVRPQSSEGEVSFFLTDTHILIGALDHNRAYVAYDLARKLDFGNANDIYSGKPQISDLSPFLLLGPSDKPNKGDFDTILACGIQGRANPATIQLDLENPNPEVRNMAQQLMNMVRSHQTNRAN